MFTIELLFQYTTAGDRTLEKGTIILISAYIYYTILETSLTLSQTDTPASTTVQYTRVKKRQLQKQQKMPHCSISASRCFSNNQFSQPSIIISFLG